MSKTLSITVIIIIINAKIPQYYGNYEISSNMYEAKAIVCSRWFWFFIQSTGTCKYRTHDLFGSDLISILLALPRVYLRFAQLLGSGKARRLCASAIVAPIVSSVNVRSTDILRKRKLKERAILIGYVVGWLVRRQLLILPLQTCV